MVDAGRILIMPKGIWSNLVSYEMLDVVTQDNIAYLARQSSVGVSPKNDSSYTYWQPFGTSVTPDGETIIMDSTDNLAVNLDNKSLIYNGNLAVNIDNKSLKCENNLAVNIDNKSLVYDDTNMYVKVAIDGSTIKYDSVHGYLYVDASNFNINDLNNIAITSPADGQTLVYDSTTQKWKNGQGQSSISSVISDAWNASTTYAVGQYCIYNNSLWKCLVQHSGQTPTEGTYWTKVTVANEITSVNNSFNDSLSPHWSTKQTIMTNPSNGTTYTCTEDCWIQLQVNGGNNSIGVSLTVNENNISAVGGATLFIIFPPVRCKKNDVIKFNSWGATPNELYVNKFN